jgi:hypothetical protein
MPVRPCLLRYSRRFSLALAIGRQRRALLQGECGGNLLGGQQGDQRQEDVTVRWYPSAVLCLAPKATELLRSSEITRRVKNGLPGPKIRLPLYPRKQTQLGHRGMSEGANRRHRLACSITSSAAASSAGRIRAMKTAGYHWPGLSASSDFDLCRQIAPPDTNQQTRPEEQSVEAPQLERPQEIQKILLLVLL